MYFMTKQVTFLVDENIKKRAQSRAKNEGLSLKTVMIFSLKAYSEGQLQFGIARDNDLDVEKIDIKDKNLLKKVDELEELIVRLEKQGKLPKGSLSEQLKDV